MGQRIAKENGIREKKSEYKIEGFSVEEFEALKT